MRKDNGISLDREDLDAQLQVAAEKQKKAKKKKKIRRLIIIIAIIAVILIIGIVIIIAAAASKTMGSTVTVVHAKEGELTQEVKITGIVKSDNVQSFFAPASLEITKCAPVGSFVKKGEPIVQFDKEDYEIALRQLELSDKIEENTYQSTLADVNNTRSKLANAQADVNKYQAEMDALKPTIDKYETDDALEKFATAVETQIGIEQDSIAKYQLQMQALPDPTSDEYKALAAKITQCNAVIANVSKQLSDQQKEYTKAKQDYAESELKRDSAKAQAESYQSMLGNSYDRENIDLQGELKTLQSGSAYEELSKYENGCLLAPFDGIVTNSMIAEGMSTVVGTQMISFSSIDEVSIAFSVTKKDLTKIEVGQEVKVTILDKDYEGTVSSISRMANASASGTSTVSAEIKINNPDDDIYLGIEAKGIIVTGHEDNCLNIPSESLNVDGDGYFVYIVNDENVVEKRPVEIGLSSDADMEITSGITTDDKIVEFVSSQVFEGATVIPVDVEEFNALLGGSDEDGGISVELGL